jgi:hypothetical protein
VFTVDGDDVSGGDVVELASGTDSVDVIAEPSDVEATVAIDGDSDLQPGDNILAVTVTAGNGTPVVYTVTLRVALSSDATLGVFTVDGDDVVDGGVVLLDSGTTAVDVFAEPSDVEATAEIAGDSDLEPGDNTLTVTVTAGNGTPVVYTVTLRVALSRDASLEVFTVDGEDVSDGDVVEFEFGVTTVDVIAEPSDVEATAEITGDSDLQVGDNKVTVTVTAGDGTEATYTVTIRVDLNNDASLEVFNVYGQDVLDGDVVEVEPGTTAVEVIAEPSSIEATVAISFPNLQPGDNTLTVAVTAADGTEEIYTVTLSVAASSDASLETFTVNGNVVVNGDVVPLGARTTSVNVVAKPSNAEANAEIDGDSDLGSGDNTLTVTVTAGDGTKVVYTVTLRVALSNDTSLAIFTVDGENVQDGDVVELEYNTRSVEVDVEATDLDAEAVVTGGTSLVDGDNVLSVRVTAADGTVFTHRVTLSVFAPDDNTALSLLEVNGESILDEEDTASFPYATPTLTLAVVTEAPSSTFTATWPTFLKAGSNTLTIRVEAESGDVEIYTRTIILEAPSTDNRLRSFSVNGVAVPVGSTQILAKGATSVALSGVAENIYATVAVTPITLKAGLNTLTITVTAQSGDKKAYTVTAIVPKAVLTAVIGFPKVGVVTVDSRTNKAGNALLLSTIKKVTTAKGIVAKVDITNNFLIKKDKTTAGATRAANVQKLLKILKTNNWSKATYELKAGLTSQKGTTVTIYYY